MLSAGAVGIDVLRVKWRQFTNFPWKLKKLSIGFYSSVCFPSVNRPPFLSFNS